MAVNVADIASLLLREYLFQGLSVQQVTEIAAQFEPVDYEPGQVVFYQWDQADSFYYVYRGQVVVTETIRNREVELNKLNPGDFFGEESLLTFHPRAATVTAVNKSILLRLNIDRFNRLLQQYPEINSNLSATAESRRLARQERFDWLEPDEVIYLIIRKHDFFLFLSMIVPVIFGVASLPVLVFGFAGAGPFALATGAGMLLVALAWGVWNYLDWANDYYMVTSKRVVWLEKVIMLYDSRREAPLDAVLATDVVSSQLGRIFKYGNVNVRTYTGSILMRNAREPYLFAAFVDGYKNRTINISHEKELERIERDLEEALKQRLDPNTVKPPHLVVPLRKPQSITPPKTGGLKDILKTFLKVRYEVNGVITYRKHWFLLLQKAWAPLLGLFALVAFDTFLIVERMFGVVGFAFSSLAGIILLGWLVYHYWDWNNDIYRLTPTQILDIERKPLGREQKKTANLDSPDFRVEHERANLIGILLNFGNVIVSVGQTKFTFEGVYNPDEVHQDVADYREALTRKKQQVQAQTEHERMLDWLMTYYNRTER